MMLTRAGDVWIVHAPAKLNLFFEVHAERSDGYHEIESLMCPIDLYDSLEFQTTDVAIELTCQQAIGVNGSAEACLPQPEKNLVYRAVELLRCRSGISRGIHIRLMKRIPLQAGLGGGSSDAAAALAGANRVWGLGWSTERLAALANELGSDVPFFLMGGPAVSRGRGEKVTPVNSHRHLAFVLVKPSEGLSTPEVYRACRPADSPASIRPICDAFQLGLPEALGPAVFNRLRPVAEELCPAIGRLREVFTKLDVLGHEMTGSGTAYFGVCRHIRHARRLARSLSGLGVGSVFAVQSCL